MLTSTRLGQGATLLAMLFALGCGADGAPGTKGDPGPAGTDGPAGDAGKDGVVPPLTSEVTGTVTDGAGPLQGASVTVSPGSGTATTDAAGAFSIKALEVGAYALTVHLDGYLDQTIPIAVNLSGGTKVEVTLAVDITQGTPPAVSASDILDAGFGKPVSLTATVTGKAPFTYKWTQLRGPSVPLTGADTDTLSLTTQDFGAAMGQSTVLNARFGVLGINPDQAGNYVFELEAIDVDGRATRLDVRVNATRPTVGLRMAPLGVPVWLQGDGDLATSTVTGATAAQATWNWTIDLSGAPGSTATLAGATAQFPSFTPDVKGSYKLTETVAGKTMTVYAGTWLGAMTPSGDPPAATCGLCHTGIIASDNFTPWKKSQHFKALADKLDGVTTEQLTEDRLASYTVGYDKSAPNGGFDDLEGSSSWTLPAKAEPGNWAKLVNDPKLGLLAGIQCESCHGPQAGPTGGPHTSSTGANPDINARISLSSDVCASCHQDVPYQYKTSQWAAGGHSNLELALGEGSVEKNANNLGHCGRCHAAQGYLRYSGQLAKGYYGYLTSDGKPLDTTPAATNHKATSAELAKTGMTAAEVQPITCTVCHDPHDATNPAQLRAYDKVASLPNGMTNVSGMGSGLICATCHNSRNGEHSDYALNATDTNGLWVPTTLASFGAPHASAQTDMVFGFNAFFMPRYSPSAHLAVKDTCAGCHYGIATDAQQAAKEDKNHSFVVDNTICAACHSSNVDGSALQSVNQLQVDGLFALLAKKTLDPIKAWMNAPNPQFYVRAYDPVSAAYSSSSSTTSNVAITTIPTSIDWYWLGTNTAMLVLHLPTPVTFTPVGATTPVTTSDVYTNVSAVRTASTNNATAVWNATTATAANVQVMYKAYWNGQLLRNDNTKGIHNPSFFNGVIAKTSAVLQTLP